MHFDYPDNLIGSLEHLGQLKQLRHLDLSVCSLITDAGLEHLRNLDNLQHLNLSRCSLITDAGLEHLCNLDNLQHLDLSDCNLFTWRGIVCILARIRHLNIHHDGACARNS